MSTPVVCSLRRRLAAPGFTLIEVLVAISLLGFGLLSVAVMEIGPWAEGEQQADEKRFHGGRGPGEGFYRPRLRHSGSPCEGDLVFWVRSSRAQGTPRIDQGEAH